MKKRIIVISVIVLLLIIGVIVYSVKEDKNMNKNEDAIAFKLEHEELNGLVHPNNSERVHKDMYIPEDNPFVFSTFDEIIDLLENNGTGVVYLGFPICPWCRNLVPVLTDAAIEFGVEEIMYRNILEDRNLLELDNDGNIVELEAGNPGYYRLMELLGDHVPVYRDLEDDSIRRIYVPAVIFIKDGEVVRYFQNLASFEERVPNEPLGSFTPMNEEEQRELKEIFLNYFSIIFNR